jgi:hypothetical protein
MNIAYIVLPVLTGICGALFNLSTGGAALSAVGAYMGFGMATTGMLIWWVWMRHSEALSRVTPRF